jgi:ADP-ribosylglycohydrolase
MPILRGKEMSKDDHILSTILGGAIGDALGVPVEFKTRGTFKVTGMIGHGTYNQPKGTWSDDTSLTLCLMENIIEGGDDESLMKKFSDYLAHGYMTPHDECFDIGNTTARAIEAFRRGTPALRCGQTGENENGNGALMRIAPVVFLDIDNDDIQSRVELVERYSSLTHAHLRSLFGCILYVEYLRQLSQGMAKEEAIDAAIALSTGIRKYEGQFSHYSRILSGEIKMLERGVIRSGGYVVDTLEAAIWCFLKHDTYRNTVLEAVNLGGDTDTTGIVAGSLAGMYYGREAIPMEWINQLARVEYIKALCIKFAKSIA